MTACKIHRATASQGDHQPIFTPERATPGSPLLDDSSSRRGWFPRLQRLHLPLQHLKNALNAGPFSGEPRPRAGSMLSRQRPPLAASSCAVVIASVTDQPHPRPRSNAWAAISRASAGLVRPLDVRASVVADAPSATAPVIGQREHAARAAVA